ncbi:MAG TPA: hypothetical protein VMU33_20365 [Burkholderiaceae bacterium]|nr:hypothetical protein [Burkholderiaceae bacterium]
MYLRAAFFEGRIRPGFEEAFERFVDERLVPLWTRFPGATRVEVLREVEADEGAQRYPMVLQISYPDRAAIERALSSAVRYESRALTQQLLQLFEGRVFHVVFRQAGHATAADA